jgi:YVTN family beta-propeller protein
LRVSELPQGTVTFLFTDIEGSTELLKRLGPRYHEVLEAHARILREAASSHGGSEVDNQGDSFFFAFARANAALGAAVVAQRALAGHEWPDGAQVRVRMGLHTGEPSVGGERYIGLGVHRAARIGAAGHGGQVLLSNPTRELVEEELHGVVIRELGLYRLKDIDHPERLYELDIAGLPSEFPPLKADKVEPPRRFARRSVAIVALAAAVAIAVAVPVLVLVLGRGNGPSTTLGAVTGDSVGFLDATSMRLVADPGVGATPTRAVVGDGAIWVANSDGNSVSRIDPKTRAVIQTIAVGDGPSGIAVGAGAVWVANSLDGTVSRIAPATNTVVQTIRVGNGPVGVVSAGGSVWVANTGDGTITKIDAAAGKVVGKPLPVAGTRLAFGAGSLWAVDPQTNQVVRIDSKTGETEAMITVGNRPAAIAFGDGGVWVANSLDGTVTRIDSGTNTVSATVENVGDGLSGLAVAPNGVWVSSQFDGTLSLISTRTDQVTRRVTLGSRLQDVALSGPDVLVAVRSSGAGHRGGTLRIRMSNTLHQIDFAVAYSTASWPFERLAGDGLVAFDQTSGLAGTQLVPDLAASLPAPTDGGKTYTFRLRPNVRFSNGKRLRASDVVFTFERDFRVGVPVTYYNGIVGGAACATRPKRCDLSRGIVADDAAGTVSFHLVAPDSEFLYQLALPFAYVVPAGTPTREVESYSLPGTGPYVIAKFRPGHQVAIVRNRYFREWSKAAQPAGYPDRFAIRFGGSGDAQFQSVVAGRADFASSALASVPPTRAALATIKTTAPGQLHENSTTGTEWEVLNARVPPFDNLDARRALSYAIDRAGAVSNSGGPDFATTTCQILPPDFPGYRPYCPYTSGPESKGRWAAPDLARARALVERSGTRGMHVTVWTTPAVAGFGRVAARALKLLGYRVSLKSVPDAAYFRDIADSHNRPQIAFGGWFPDYPAASNFFTTQFTCASFAPDDENNENLAEFCDPGIDRSIARALRVEAVNTPASNENWAGVDRAIVDQAVVVPLVNPKNVDVVSKRVGNYQYSANGLGALLDQLWVQ